MENLFSIIPDLFLSFLPFEAHSKVTNVFITLIFLFFAIPFVTMTLNILRKRSELNRVLKSLSGLKRGEGSLPEKVKWLQSTVFHSPVFGDLWWEFREALVARQVEGEIRYFNTIDSEHFFSFQKVGGNLHIYTAIPGILTGLGILGTFVGILFGLQDIDSAFGASGEIDHMLTGVQSFLSGMKIAFISSAVGLTSALIFGLVEKYLFGKIDEDLEAVNKQINRVFPRQTSEDLLKDLIEQGQSQSEALNTLADDIGASVVTSLTSGGLETSGLSSDIKEGMSKGFDNVGKSLAEFSEAQKSLLEESKVVTENMKNLGLGLVNLNRLEASIREKYEQVNNDMTSSINSLAEASESVSDLMTQVNGAVHTQSSAVESLEKASGYLVVASEKITPLSDAIESSMTKGAGILSDSLQEYEAKVGESQKHLFDGLSSSYKLLDDELAKVVEKLGKSVQGINELVTKVNNTLHEVHEKLSADKEKDAS